MRKFIVSSLAVLAIAAGGFGVYTAQAQSEITFAVCKYGYDARQNCDCNRLDQVIRRCADCD
jgi:hypothetical protein